MLIVTIALFITAITFGLIAWRLWRDERERFRARAASLAAAIDGPSSTSWPSALDEFGAEQGSTQEPVAVQSLFDTERHSFVQGQPLMKIAIGLAMAVAVIVIISMTSVRRETPTAQAKPPESSLELLSMSHLREGETLTITGLVRNASDSPAQGITAVVFAFDHGGTFVTSGRAQLDDLTIGPGDESPFEVVIPRVRDVGRYRVSFRTEAGVVRHLDRRHEGVAPTAGSQRPSGLRAATGGLRAAK